VEKEMVFEKSLARTIWTSTAKTEEVLAAETPATVLRLLIMTQFFPPDFAATGQLIEELVNHLGRQNVNVSVFTGQPGYAFAKNKAPEIEQKGRVWVKRSRMTQLFSGRIRGKAINGLLFSIRSIFHLIKCARRYQILLITTAPPFLPIIGYLGNVFLGLPYVCLLYDLYPDIAIELEVIKSDHPVSKLWRFVNRQVWQRSAGIVVLSDSMKQRVVEHCPKVKDKISVIHSWSNDQQIVPIEKGDNWFAKKHGLRDSFVVMYSGNMGRCHDVETILEAAKYLRNEPIQFVCIGGGAKRGPLMQAITAAGLNNFLFLPYQEKSVLPYSLTACDLSIISIIEGMESLVAPSKLYPAMAAGRPIAAICPPNSYLGELLKAAEGGAVFNNGEAAALAQYIRYLSQNQHEAKRLGKSCRKYMQAHFTPRLIARQYLEVIRKSLTHSYVVKETSHAERSTVGQLEKSRFNR
jgi:glycosyltransferase involved in cell wall biosynthesis